MFGRNSQRGARVRGGARTGFRRRLWADYVKPIGTAVLVALVIRQFVIQAFRIPSPSMVNTLLVGDFLFVNKYLYGARTPERIRIPLVNWTLADDLPVLKLPPLRAPRRGDIIVFEFPKDRTQDYIKRCVAVAGDRVEVKQGLLRVNGELYEDALDHPGRVTQTQAAGARNPPHTLHDPASGARAFGREYGLAEALRTEGLTPRRFVEMVEAAGAAGVGLDPAVLTGDLEPLRAHVDGRQTLTVMEMSRHMGALYTAAAATDAPFVVPPGTIFMMGDNRDNSYDSRGWGPLDLDLVKGKAIFIYWSWDAQRFLPRLSRIGDLIR
jgi:signal peptidase I